MKTKLHYVFATAIFLTAFSVFGQNNFFVKVQNQKKETSLKSTSKASTSYQFNYQTLSIALQKASDVSASKTNNVTISFPNTQGELERYKIVESSVMHPDLQAKYPEIKSYIGYGIDSPSAYLRFSLSPFKGLCGIILGKEHTEIFEPNHEKTTQFTVKRKADLNKNKSFNCKTTDVDSNNKLNKNTNLKDADDSIHRLYTLALSVTGEYANFHGGTLTQINAALAATLTNVNAVFENDFNVTLQLAANNDNVIYLNAATDPYSGFSGYSSEVQTTLDAEIGDANYDVGHLLSAIGFDGNAGCIGCVCDTGLKGSGYTSDSAPDGFNFDIDLVAHELGHQFGANHTWTHDGNEGTNVQMEPGSGTTVMGYAGIAASANIKLHSDPYFHAISIQQITNYIKTTSCAAETNTGNTTPTVDAGPNLILPIGTPFRLTGIASDSDGDNLTYCWEQINENNAQTTYPDPNSGNNGAVLFRSFLPSSSPTRHFPNLSDIRFGVNANQWEKVPNVARTADFRLTVRDNKPGGANNTHDDMRVTFNPDIGPFRITSQNTTGVFWSSGTTETITWDVNDTNTLPGASNVNILLSTDGGITYNEIASNIPNNGSHSLTVPDTPSTTCRLMIEPTNNNFFAINAEDFGIDFSLTTTCTRYSSANNLGINITDNSGFSESHSINISDTATIEDINIGVNINHSFIGDLGIQIVSPNGTTATLKTFDDCDSEENMIGLFDDDAIAFNCFNAANNISQKSLNDLLEVFNGESITGNWTIRLGDFQPDDFGRLNSWFIEVCQSTSSELDSSEFAFEKIKLFPNPNGGEFTIKSESAHPSKNIKIEIFDVKGRIVYVQEFKNTTRLDETVNLRNIQPGLYIMYLSDGSDIHAKRIAIR